MQRSRKLSPRHFHWLLLMPMVVFCYFLTVHLRAGGRQPSAANGAAATDDASRYVGNEACAKCHAGIYATYMRTAMAHASGPADENFIAGEFTHKPSGVRYAVYRDAGKVWLKFERPGDPLLNDKREFLYYIGEGRRGRTYLFTVDGFVFESPVNWYADRRLWDMAPAYGNAKEMPLNLPTTTSCLHCHVSGAQAPLGGSENLYRSPPFLYAGVTCERCHGPGEAHAAGGAIVNPAKLPAKLRDQVCMQCHLEGNAAIERAGKKIYEYKPGDDLSQFVRYFVFTGNVPAGLGATSQFESLAQSMCKKKSGDALTCSSCHGPHQAVGAENKVAFYRAKCIACHGERFAAKHHSKQQDCAACHMPHAPSADIAHTEVSDHRIRRRPEAKPSTNLASSALPDLAPFPASNDGEKNSRDLALAWQSLVTGGMSMAQPKAQQLLREALRDSPNDAALLSALAYLAQEKGQYESARALYQKALQQDPSLLDAATNLGVLEAQSGRLPEAIKLWQSAFERAPGKSEIGMNLARVYCGSGQWDAARQTVQRVLRFNPDLAAAKKLSMRLNAGPSGCAP